ncbi:terpenoid cyclases/Protein prenyltransferase [Xylariomycetidae sp. FL2044]|nr:terpenoid cyclases/Protein prenyltransferase [Xylariomycetidae sp. FL2044]
MTQAEPPLDTARHIRYWQRCFRSLLPHQYTSSDSTRLFLACFILSALDLLSPTQPSSSTEDTTDNNKPLVTSAERDVCREWIMALQHRNGGFCGSPHHVSRDRANANLGATFFALMSLAVLDDSDGSKTFQSIKRKETLRWLRKLQREDGSFGEVVTKDGYIGGGSDMRYCYLAAAIRYMLGGGGRESDKDFNVDALVAYIRKAQTFDGGIGETSAHESHAGYSYCAVAALALLDLSNPNASSEPNRYLHAGISSIPSLIHFLVGRQVIYLDSENSEDEEDDQPDTQIPDLSTLSLSDPATLPVGFNGRCNKDADTCYAWWVSATLSLLGEADVVDRAPARRFILEKTQHIIGGFGKYAGSPPDLYHAYLGLAALGTLGASNGGNEGKEDGLKEFDARLCASTDVLHRIEKARESLLAPRPKKTETTADDSDSPWVEDIDAESRRNEIMERQKAVEERWQRAYDQWKAEGNTEEPDSWDLLKLERRNATLQEQNKA